MFHNGFTAARLMRVSYKAVLGHHQKLDGTRPIYLQVILDRHRLVFPIGVCINPKYFEKRTGIVKNYPEAQLINTLVEQLRSKAARIVMDYMIAERYLTPDQLRKEMGSNQSRQDFIGFARQELELRRPNISKGTAEQNGFALDKISAFRPVILFSELTVELIQEYQNWERKTYGNTDNTINKTLTTWKLYLNAAKRKGIKFSNPFEHFSIRKVKPPKVSLSMDEFTRLLEYFRDAQTDEHHRKLLRYFLFCCANGIRISDIDQIRWSDLHGNTLRFIPQKTERTKKVVEIPLSEFELSLLPECTDPSTTIFETYAHQVANRMLKKIATACNIKKRLTFHVSRHTFGTLFLERGGRVEVLKELMGHSDIDTTMVYVHMSDKRKEEQKREAFDKIEYIKP